MEVLLVVIIIVVVPEEKIMHRSVKNRKMFV